MGSAGEEGGGGWGWGWGLGGGGWGELVIFFIAKVNMKDTRNNSKMYVLSSDSTVSSLFSRCN